MIETIDSTKLADKVSKAVSNKEFDGKLNVMVQVNTSNEPRKSMKKVM